MSLSLSLYPQVEHSPTGVCHSFSARCRCQCGLLYCRPPGRTVISLSFTSHQLISPLSSFLLSLLTPPLPFSSCPLFIISLFVCMHVCRPSSVSMLELALKYLLLCPDSPVLAQADILHQQLLQLARNSHPALSSHLLGLLVRISAFYQSKDTTSLWSTSQRVSQLVQLVVKIRQKKFGERDGEGLGAGVALENG